MAAVMEVIIRAKDEASDVIEDVGAGVNDMSRNFKIAGGIMLAGGAAIGGMLGYMAKEAASQEAGIVRLRLALQSVGISYDEVGESLEETIALTQQKTSIADTDQRDSLSLLVRATGDLTKALQLNQLAMDISVGLGTDLSTATRMVFYAMNGTLGMLRRYGIQIAENATAEEAIAELQRQFAGQAEAYGETVAGQWQLMMANLGDAREAVGLFVANALKPLISQFSRLANWFANLDPMWQSFIAYGGMGTAALLTLGGALLLFIGMLPTLKKGLDIIRTANLRGAAAAAAHGVASAVKSVAGVPVVGPWLVAGAVAAVIAAITYGVMRSKSLFAGLELGGDVERAGVFRVGERGPELAYLPAGTAVTPARTAPVSRVTYITNEFLIDRIIIREEADIEKVAIALEALQRDENRAKGLVD